MKYSQRACFSELLVDKEGGEMGINEWVSVRGGGDIVKNSPMLETFSSEGVPMTTPSGELAKSFSFVWRGRLLFVEAETTRDWTASFGSSVNLLDEEFICCHGNVKTSSSASL